MKTVTNRFARGLGVGLVGLLALLLFVFFVSMFVSGRMDASKSRHMTSGSMPSFASPMVMKMESRGNGMDASRGMEISVVQSDAMMPAMDRKVMKNGSLNLRVGSVSKARCVIWSHRQTWRRSRYP